MDKSPNQGGRRPQGTRRKGVNVRERHLADTPCVEEKLIRSLNRAPTPLHQILSGKSSVTCLRLCLEKKGYLRTTATAAHLCQVSGNTCLKKVGVLTLTVLYSSAVIDVR